MWGRQWWKVWENEVTVIQTILYTVPLFALAQWYKLECENDLLQIVIKNCTCQLIILACSENVHSSRE